MGRKPPPVMVASRKDVLSAIPQRHLLTPVLHGLGDEAKAALRAADHLRA